MPSNCEAAGRWDTKSRLLGFGLVAGEIFKDRDQKIVQSLPIFGRDSVHCNTVGVYGQRFQNGLKIPTLPSKVDMLLSPVAIFRAPLDDFGLFELCQRTVHRGLCQAGQLAQLLLGQPLLLPKDAQENPMTEGNAMLRQSTRQRTIEAACSQSDKMRDPFLGVVRRWQTCRQVLTFVIFQCSIDPIVSLTNSIQPRGSWKALTLRAIWRALTQADPPRKEEPDEI